jgi:preprotein translocase subunit SecG
MTLFLTVVHVLVCLILIVVVLLQRGKGAEIGAVFGGGASNTVFGSRGAGNFFTRLTTGAAVIFMVTSLVLSYLATQRSQESLFDDEPAAAEEPAGGTADSPFSEIPGAAAPSEPEAPAAPPTEPAPAEPAPADAPAAAPATPPDAPAP